MRSIHLIMVLLAILASQTGVSFSNDEGQPTWPVTLVVGRDQAVVCNNYLFLQGDSLTFRFKADTLWCNDLVWQSHTPPEAKPDTSKKGRWLSELRARYNADTTGTPEQRMKRALGQVETGVLDPEYPPEVGEFRLVARFMDGEHLMMQFVDFGPKIVPEESAADAVAFLRKRLTRPEAFVFVHYPKRGYIRGDVRIVRAFERARQGKLTAADRALARGNYILEAMEAVAERARESGRESDK